MVSRQELAYPPAAHLCAVRFDGADAAAVAATAARLADGARRHIAGSTEVQLLGPAEAPIQKLKGRTRWLLLLKARSRPALRKALEMLLAEAEQTSRVRVSVDVDPLFLL